MKKTTVGIICAGDDELAPFLPMITDCNISEKAMLKFYSGKIDETAVTALFSGVCKVNAAVAAQILIDTYKCNIIINSGTAGAVSDNIKVLDTVVSTETAYHDVNKDILTDFHPWLSSVWIKSDAFLTELAKISAKKLSSDFNIVFGKTVTGEHFINGEEKQSIAKIFNPLSVDMESAAVAHVRYVNKIPFISVRTITDAADSCAEELFEQNCLNASCKSADFVRLMLNELHKK